MSMSPSMQIALSAWAGVAVIGLGLLLRLLRERKEPGWQDFAFGIPAAALIATWIYEGVHEGGLPRTGRLIRDGAFLVIAVAGLVGSARTLKTFWHDDDERAEYFGSSEGYIPHRQLIPQRYKDLLSVVALLGLIAAISIYFFMSLFAPE
jgi:hypothetical protein